MPRKPTLVSEEIIVFLRDLIRIKSNLSCLTSSEIRMLKDEIANVTDVTLSVQTLNRVMGVVKNDFKPSIHTLDTLAKYLNYHSFNDFQVLLKSDTLVKADNSEFVWTLFLSMFADLNVTGHNNSQEISRNILRWMKMHPNMNGEIYTAFAKTAYGRVVFFHDFVNVDLFNYGFGKGLQHYLVHAQNKHEKFIIYTLHCYRHFLNGEREMFRKYFRLLEQFRHSEVISFSPALVDRYYAIFVLNKIIDPAETGGGMHAMTDFDMFTSSSTTTYNSCYYVGEALLLIGEFHSAYQVFSRCNVRDMDVPNCLKDDFALQIRIFRLVSGYFSNAISHRKTLAEYLDIYKQPLSFLQESYLSMFMLLLKYKLYTKPKLRKNVKQSFDRVVDKTGFRYFRSFHDLVSDADTVESGALAEARY